MGATRFTAYFATGCAKPELSYGKDPMMSPRAEEIIPGQQSEIDAMNR